MCRNQQVPIRKPAVTVCASFIGDNLAFIQGRERALPHAFLILLLFWCLGRSFTFVFSLYPPVIQTGFSFIVTYICMKENAVKRPVIGVKAEEER